MNAPYCFVSATGIVFILLQMALSMSEDVISKGPTEEEASIRVDQYMSNSAPNHVYPYVASFVTFVCIFVSLMMVICYAPILGR